MKRTPLIFLLVSILFCTNTFAQDVWEWSKNYGGSNADSPTDMIKTVDGGIIITGWTESFDGDVSGHSGLMDFWIVNLTDCQPSFYLDHPCSRACRHAFGRAYYPGGGEANWQRPSCPGRRSDSRPSLPGVVRAVAGRPC